MGMKNKAKQIMIEVFLLLIYLINYFKAGVPVIHGYNGPNQDTEYLFEEAKQIGLIFFYIF